MKPENRKNVDFGDNDKQNSFKFNKKHKHYYRKKEKNKTSEQAIAGDFYEQADEADSITNMSATEKTQKKEVCSENLEEYEVVGVRFKQNGKIYYFDPAGLKIKKDFCVIVDTARGMEFGTVIIPNRTVSAKEIVLPLRKVLREATEEDKKHRRMNEDRETEAYNLCLSKIEEHRLEMKLVDVEYTFDNTKLIFYFTAEGRVDFRDLVKDLAAVFKTRIELRQIGIRDEAKLLGGLGACGRPFCCASFLPDFVQVSIKMAKEQNLSLNSSKISGACGRLMCCLRYEHDIYAEEIAKTPKVDTVVETPDGEGIIVETTPLVGKCKVCLNKNPSSVRTYDRDDLVVKELPSKNKRKEEEEHLDS